MGTTRNRKRNPTRRRKKPRKTREDQVREYEDLLKRAQGDFRSWHVREPALLFRDGHRSPDPKTGIELYGPWSTPDDPPLKQIRVGIIGTGETIQQAQAWFIRCRRRVDPTSEQDADPALFPSFPGVETDTGFNCSLDMPPSLTETLSSAEIAQIIKAPNRDLAVEAAGRIVRNRLESLSERDLPPSVVVVSFPLNVREVAGSGRKPPRRRRKTKKQSTQLELSFLDPKPQEPFSRSRTLHRVVKAEGMRVGLPTQMAWPTSFTGGEEVQDDATRAWNFCTALYYKAGGIPWRVTGLGRNTCYVGISFYRPIDAPDQLQTSMAQAFSDRNEGTVLRGEPFSWDLRLGPPQLPREAASNLLTRVLEQYRKHHQQSPARVVVHKTSIFSQEEMAGMQDALNESVAYHDFLSTTESTIRFLRAGYEPPLRGTVIEVCQNQYVVYTRGYIPFLNCYPGLRIPQPSLVTHSGTGAVTQLMSELLALSRMNWNSADFASADPITLGFARNVGLILSELPDDIEPSSSFRFYM